MRAAVISAPSATPACADFPDPEPIGDKPLLELVGAGLHQVVRSLASGGHYGSSGTYPLVPGVDAVARTPAGRLVYTGRPRAPWGTMAELLATPIAVPIPDGADPLAVAAGMNPAKSSWMPLRRHLDERGELGTVLVLGATGMSGHLAVQAAVALGASPVIAAGRDAAALERAVAAGAEPVSIADGTDALVAPLAASTPALVLDYVWGPVAEGAFAALGRRGLGEDDATISYVSIGSLAGAEAAVPSSLLRSRNLTISCSGAGSIAQNQLIAALPDMIGAIADGTLHVPYATYPLSRVEDFWGHTGRERAVLVPD